MEKQARDAEERLRRLYALIETGLAELDDILKERIEALKLDRDRASMAFERAKDGARQHIEIGPALIEQFGCMMREKLSNGDNASRKTYISSIEVDDGQVRIIGRKEVLEQAVRATVPKWRTRQDSNL